MEALLSVHRMCRVEALGYRQGRQFPWPEMGQTDPIGHSHPGVFGFEGWFSFLFTFL